MTQAACLDLCKKIAPKYGLDPILLLALIEQESSYDEKAIRLENGFYRRYVKPQGLSPSVSVLLSASYGLTQCMGWTLHEMNYFAPTTNSEIARQIDEYILDPSAQIEYGARWLKKKQSSGTIEDGLRRYNGSALYPPQVMVRYNKLIALGL